MGKKWKTPTHLLSHTEWMSSKKKMKNCNSLSVTKKEKEKLQLTQWGRCPAPHGRWSPTIGWRGCGSGRSGWDWDCAFGKSVFDWVSLSLYMWIRSIYMKFADVKLSLSLWLYDCLWIRPELWLIWFWHWLYECESGGFSLDESFGYGMDCMNVNILDWLPWSGPPVI